MFGDENEHDMSNRRKLLVAVSPESIKESSNPERCATYSTADTNHNSIGTGAESRNSKYNFERHKQRKNALRMWRSFDPTYEKVYKVQTDEFLLPPLTWDDEDYEFDDLFDSDVREYFTRRLERCRRSSQWVEVINSYKYLSSSWIVQDKEGENSDNTETMKRSLVLLHSVTIALMLEEEWTSVWDILEKLLEKYSAQVHSAIMFILHEALDILRNTKRSYRSQIVNEVNTQIIMEALLKVKNKYSHEEVRRVSEILQNTINLPDTPIDTNIGSKNTKKDHSETDNPDDKMEPSGIEYHDPIHELIIMQPQTL